MVLVWWLVAVALLGWPAASHILDRPKRQLESLDHRLPRSVLPESYQVYLVPFNPEPFSFTGNVTITVTAAEATNQITLHANYLQISSALVRTVSVPVRELTISGLENSNDTRQFYVLRLAESLVQGTRYEIVLQFAGELHNYVFGFYKREYVVSDVHSVLAATQFEATFARNGFPCFDEPALKAKFQINVARYSNMTALSNMPLLATSAPIPELDGRLWDSFAESPRMSTYLVAVVVGDLEAARTADPRLTVWVRRGLAQLAAYSCDVSPRILRHLEGYTRLPYSLPTLQQVALPGYSVPMENWGLVVYMERNLFDEHAWSSAEARQETAVVIAHELAHQWFGNLVTADWWRYAWLNEGLAQFFSFYLLNQLEGSWRTMDQFVVTQMQVMMQIDADVSTKDLNSDCSTPEEIERKFGFISYSKGASVLRMMQHVLTEETFRNGIHSYLISRQMDTAVPGDLYSGLQTHAAADGRLTGVGSTVAGLFGRWASQAGYPLITVQRHYDNGSATVSQSRFFLTNSTVSNESWSVPLSWTSKANAPAGFAVTTPSAWMMDNQSSIKLQNVAASQDWVIFNNQEAGYYRVNYDEANWRLLAAQLNSDGYQDIHVLNRAQLLDDSLNLARAGRLGYEIALDVTRYLVRETDPIPWTAAFYGLSFIHKMLVGSEAHNKFQAYVLDLLETVYHSMGFKEDSGDHHVTSISRRHVLWWACALDHADCVQKAKDTFESWTSSHDSYYRNTVYADLKRIVYCTVVANGGNKEWNFLLSKYSSDEARPEQTLILEALGCSKNVSALNKLLQMSITENSTLVKSHRDKVFSAVCRNKRGIEICLNFVIQNFKTIRKMYGKTHAIGSVGKLAKSLTTQRQMKTMTDFLTSNKIFWTSGSSNWQTIIASVNKNILWKYRYYHAIEKWLARYKVPEVVHHSQNPTYSFSSWIYYVLLIFLQA